MAIEVRPGRARPARRLVAESWARARAGRLAPERAEAGAPIEDAELEQVRGAHPLAAALPVIRSLLVRDADDGSGVVVAVGDAAGRLLWVEGDRTLVRQAEAMRFVAGADWSESRVGTSAPGTALALDRPVQIAGGEHFALQVQQWSCTAVPVHDLETHETIGVLDITGGPDAVGPRALPLLEATPAAVERELLLARLQRSGRRRSRVAETARTPRLAVLGRDQAALTVGGRTIALSVRHAELLTLLAWHRGGLSAERLAELVHGRVDATATVRPEMVRLRHVLEGVAPALVPLARPYRLPAALDLDARQLVTLLDRGAHRAALDAYRGDVLPASVAPGIEEIRREVEWRLREALLESASPDLLLAFAEQEVGGGALEQRLPRPPARIRGARRAGGSGAAPDRPPAPPGPFAEARRHRRAARRTGLTARNAAQRSAA